MDAPAPTNRESKNDAPEKGRQGTTHYDNASDQMSIHSNINMTWNLWQKNDWCTDT